jgi:hypothetical protein
VRSTEEYGIARKRLEMPENCKAGRPIDDVVLNCWVDPSRPLRSGPSMAFGTGNPAIQNDVAFHDRQVRPLAHSSFINRMHSKML